MSPITASLLAYAASRFLGGALVAEGEADDGVQIQ
jgi:hypothetical protein